MKLVLETNIYYDSAEGQPDVVDAIATYGQFVLIPSVVLGELLFGFMKGNKPQADEKGLRQIVDRLKIEIVDMNVDVARKYAMIQSSLQKKGSKIPVHDVWVAACCMEVGGTLLTRDTHFEFVDQIDTMMLK